MRLIMLEENVCIQVMANTLPEHTIFSFQECFIPIEKTKD